jgi:hypothetical protein
MEEKIKKLKKIESIWFNISLLISFLLIVYFCCMVFYVVHWDLGQYKINKLMVQLAYGITIWLFVIMYYSVCKYKSFRANNKYFIIQQQNILNDIKTKLDNNNIIVAMKIYNDIKDGRIKKYTGQEILTILSKIPDKEV